MSSEAGNMSADRRERLVRTAAEHFASVGYEQASLNRIIRDCGLSKSSFYHFIRSKQELFDLVIRDLGQALVAEVRIPLPQDFAGGAFWTQAERLVDRLTAASALEVGFTQLGRMFYLSGAPADAESALSEASEAIEGWLHEVLAVGRRSGTVRDDLPISLQSQLVLAVLRALDEWTLRHGGDLCREDLRDLVATEYQCIRRLLDPSG
ncbi:TetR/AcrR family transcriptional regulator [Saxibacter everestensis]|uniref:TetR/AcrR family transcriptional regulator n=1 Tax=Saxibacter everestensis TaxID=2909229 RepID=A0ABY8QYF4_9MICO|nr:TetR/AcrR family transcriptional regulator [Brevibacteriaceae bacterium ZFBP1038]